MVMAKILIVFFLIVFDFKPGANDLLTELKKQALLSGKVVMLIPSMFLLMDAETLALKYPSEGHRPSEVYTNAKSTINIAINHTANMAKVENLPEIRKVMEKQFNRAPFMFIKSELNEINGSQFIILEFVSPAVDTKIYNLMAIASFEGRLVVITFNCTEAERKDWEPIGRKIIASITLKE
jgi:hypothetical protein